MSNLLTVREAADLFYAGVRPPAAYSQYMYSLVGRGLVKASRIGSKTYILEDSLKEYMAKKKRKRDYATRPTPEDCGLDPNTWIALWQIEEQIGRRYLATVNFCARNGVTILHKNHGAFLEREFVKTSIPRGPLLDLDMNIWMPYQEFLEAVNEPNRQARIKLQRHFSARDIDRNTLRDVTGSTNSYLAIRRDVVDTFIKTVKPPIPEDTISQSDAARLAGISRQAIHQFVCQGKIDVHLVGNRTLIDRNSFEEWLTRR